MATTDPRALRLGAFDLHEVIGRGGMGEVWRGVHHDRGLPIAAKVLTHASARQPQAVEGFAAEVRAVASLDHPCIVTVHDHGVVGVEAARASEGRLVEGSPFLIMEPADRGSVRGQQTGWAALRALLLALLDGLAHAHARGLLHFDVKPANVLCFAGPKGTVVPKLADFGLARVQGIDQDGQRVAGTPAFMAPERLTGAWRDCGPWTDLYSLGCMAFLMATGRLPFEGDTMVDMAAKHLLEPAPELAASPDLPEGLGAWLRKLLAKRPRDRFAFAADAAAALLELAPPIATKAPGIETAAEPDAPTEDVGSVLRLGAPLPSAAAPPAAARSPELARPPQAVFPAREAADRERRPSAGIEGPGLGLYGLRPVPLVDRDVERDRLWEMLAGVHQRREAAAAVLRGPAGVGKSRLAQWLCERAHELGAALPLRAVHGPTGGAADGLRAMLARELRVLGLSRPEALGRIRRLLGELGVEQDDAARAVAELCMPSSAEGEPLVRFGGPADVYARLASLLGWLGRDRPTILWLDDAQWGAEAIGFAEHVLTLAPRTPSLLVLTVREEALAERTESTRIDALLASPGATALAIEPLPRAETHRLVYDLLRLEGGVAAQVAERAAGNPLFAVQLVGDWIDRGLLEPDALGFRLREGATEELPDDLHSIWGARIEKLLATLPGTDRIALEIAACLGQDVDDREWRLACQRLGAAPSARLLEALLGQRLARPIGRDDGGGAGSHHGWSFVHGMLRESLLRIAREAGRSADQHLSCASMLEEHGSGQDAERVARHAIAAGVAGQAIAPLLTAAEARWRANDFHLALELLAQRRTVLEGLGVAQDDVRWAEGWTVQALILDRLRRADEAEVVAGRASELAQRKGMMSLAAVATVAQAKARIGMGRLEQAREQLQVLEARLDERTEPDLMAACLSTLAYALRRLGQHEVGRRTIERARSLYELAGDPLEAGRCLSLASQLAFMAGDLDAAGRLASEAVERFSALGSRVDRAHATNSLGEVARLRSDLPSAEAFYRSVWEELAPLGDPHALMGEFNLAQVLIERGEIVEATRLLDDCRRKVELQREPVFQALVHGCLARCGAMEERWSSTQHHLHCAEELFRQTGVADLDLAHATTRCGDRLAALGQRDLAARSYRIALDQWRLLGATAEERRVAEALATLPSPRE
ncbi:MAG: protein kinase [Deltaproteobacteria bacterium]|nr:protein kinase [Deltaproteobacteria bacterium]